MKSCIYVWPLSAEGSGCCVIKQMEGHTVPTASTIKTHELAQDVV